MPFTKEQLRAYWKVNKEILNQKRKTKRRLAKLGLANSGEVSHNKVSHKMANLPEVSRGKPFLKMANLKLDHQSKLAQLIHQYQTNTNYNCAPGCNEDRYCSNCWYFFAGELVDYKEGACKLSF